MYILEGSDFINRISLKYISGKNTNHPYFLVKSTNYFMHFTISE